MSVGNGALSFLTLAELSLAAEMLYNAREYGVVMICPKCGERWMVLDTVAGNSNCKAHLTEKVIKVISWYIEEEYVARKRRCFNEKCQYEGITVEVELDDLEEMHKIIDENKKEG